MTMGLILYNMNKTYLFMYKLKQIPEDFQVEELVNYPILKSGEFYVYKLMKKLCNTIDALNIVSRKLGISKNSIGYAGLKDRNATTSQYISIIKKRQLDDKYDFGSVALNLVGFRDERIFPGCLDKNKFDIVIRNINNKPKQIKKMINYFGEQRFSYHNVDIGKSIIKGKYNDAMDLIVKTTNDNELATYYEQNKNNPLSGIAKVSDSLIRLYLHAYQSFLWNKCVEKYIENFPDESDVIMPLIGFGMEAKGKVAQIIGQVMDDDEITIHEFILRKLPGFGLEGGERSIFVDVGELKIGELIDDDLNPRMKKCTVSFALPKGCYATEYIKQILA